MCAYMPMLLCGKKETLCSFVSLWEKKVPTKAQRSQRIISRKDSKEYTQSRKEKAYVFLSENFASWRETKKIPPTNVNGTNI